MNLKVIVFVSILSLPLVDEQYKIYRVHIHYYSYKEARYFFHHAGKLRPVHFRQQARLKNTDFELPPIACESSCAPTDVARQEWCIMVLFSALQLALPIDDLRCTAVVDDGQPEGPTGSMLQSHTIPL